MTANAMKGFVLVTACVAAFARPGSAQQILRSHEGPVGSHSQFGYSVCGLKDVTGDGKDEYAIGTPFDSNNVGTVKVFDGATGLVVTTLSATFGHGTLFGWAIDDAGDFNGDGIHDLVVGSPGDVDYAGDSKGAIHIFSGADWSDIGHWHGFDGQQFGYSVAGIGDIDGDGFDNVASGLPDLYDNGSVAILGWAYAGSGFWYGFVLEEIWGDQDDARFGFSVGGARDVNADGFPDLIVGEPYYDTTSGRITNYDAGRAYVYSGVDSSLLYTFEGDDAGDSFGYSVDGIGNSIGADPWDDVIVGAPFAEVNGIQSGYVRAFSGSSGIPLFTIAGEDERDWFGYSVRGVKQDLGNDGYDDFVIGAPSEPSDGEPGEVRVYKGNDVLAFQHYSPSTDPGSHYFGLAVETVDVNGDLRPDLIIGLPGDFWSTDVRGSAWVYQVFSDFWFDYGAGWKGTLGVPPFDCVDPADIGGRTSLFIGNSLGARTPGFLFVGLSATDVPTSLGGHLLVSDVLFTLPLAIDAGGIMLVQDIPDDPTLGGLSVFLQAIELDPGASKGVSFTDGLELVFGWDY